jgi:hypothetical protein
MGGRILAGRSVWVPSLGWSRRAGRWCCWGRPAPAHACLLHSLPTPILPFPARPSVTLSVHPDTHPLLYHMYDDAPAARFEDAAAAAAAAAAATGLAAALMSRSAAADLDRRARGLVGVPRPARARADSEWRLTRICAGGVRRPRRL